MQSSHLLVLDRSPEVAEQINSLLRNSGIKIHVLHVSTSTEVKRALDQDSPVMILYSDPDESDASLEEISQLAVAFQVPVALYTDLQDHEELVKLLTGTVCYVINSGQDDLLTDAVSRLVGNSEVFRNQALQEQYLEELEHRYNLLLDSSTDAIAYVHEGLHVYTNRAYLEALGVKDESEITGISLLEMLEAGDTNLKTFFKGLSKGQYPSDGLEVHVKRPDGDQFEATLYFSSARFDGEDCIQMMVQRREAANGLAVELEKLRLIDPLTQMHNRKAFSDRLDESIVSDSDGLAAAVLYIEADGIEDLQNELDVADLDELIVDLARIIRQNVDESDFPARISDHGFAVLVQRNSNSALEEAANRILSAYRGHVVEMGERALSATCSIGMARVGRLAMNTSDVLARARKAQSEAATEGNQLIVYRPTLTAVESNTGDVEWAERIKFALGNHDFYSVQQSIVDLDGDGEQMMENITFMRGENGDHPPPEYLDAADRNDLAGIIDRHIIPGLLKAFVESGDRQIINISNNSILDYSFPAWFANQLQAACVEGDRVILQIPASAALNNLRPAQRLLKELRPLGCHLSISEFDAERRSLQLLEHLDVSYVKMVASLTEELTGSTKNQESISRVVEAAEPQGVAVIADEVSDTSSLAVLWQSGVKLIAGAFLRESSQVIAQ